jgi:hypothetical protein
MVSHSRGVSLGDILNSTLRRRHGVYRLWTAISEKKPDGRGRLDRNWISISVRRSAALDIQWPIIGVCDFDDKAASRNEWASRDSEDIAYVMEFAPRRSRRKNEVKLQTELTASITRAKNSPPSCGNLP